MDQYKTTAIKPHRLLLFFARILLLFFLPAIAVAISVRICNYRGSPRPDARLSNPDPQQPTIRSNPLRTYLPHPHFFPTHTTTYPRQPTRYPALRYTKQSTRYPLGTYLPCTAWAHTPSYPQLPTYLPTPPPPPPPPQCTHIKSFRFLEKRRDPHKASNYFTVVPTYLSTLASSTISVSNNNYFVFKISC